MNIRESLSLRIGILEDQLACTLITICRDQKNLINLRLDELRCQLGLATVSGNQPWVAITDETIGYLMTMADWIDSVKMGAFNDYDGCGAYASADAYLQGSWVSPSMVSRDQVNDAFSHILWFNK